jgi:pyroglutamyl-peptidase
MSATDDAEAITILVTGFGVCLKSPSSVSILMRSKAFLDVKDNPSWEVVSRLPSTIPHKWLNIRLIKHPEPIKAAYHDIASVVPKLLKEDPDIVLHVGLAYDRKYFAIEKGADRDGYHQIPDVSRKVFTKAETKRLWPKSPERIDSSFDINDVFPKWQANAAKTSSDIRRSDDVGHYVCGFIYYLSLEHFWQKSPEENRPVLFLHVPPLPNPEDVRKGVDVTVGLIQALAEIYQK